MYNWIYIYFKVFSFYLILVLIVTMPSSKKTPLKGGRKKVTASEEVKFRPEKFGNQSMVTHKGHI